VAHISVSRAREYQITADLAMELVSVAASTIALGCCALLLVLDLFELAEQAVQPVEHRDARMARPSRSVS
jgi:hypothetical protein